MDKDAAITKARALYYNLFANFFIVTSDTKNYLELVRLVNILKENSLDDNSKAALESLSAKLDPTSNVELVEEYDDLFYNPVTKKVRLTASFYDEGVESGKKRLEMIQFIAKTKLRRDEENFYDNEDSMGFIFAFLAELCELSAQGEKAYDNTIHCIFAQILNDFVDEAAKEIYEHPSAVIFKDVIALLFSFIAFERLYLEVSKPKPKEKVVPVNTCENISDEEAARRARNKELKKQGPKKKEGEDEACPVDIAYDVEDNITL